MKFPFTRCRSSLLWYRSLIPPWIWNFNGGKVLEEEGDQSLPIRECKIPTFLHILYPLFIASTNPLMGLLQISPLAFQNLNSQLKNLKTAISPKPLNQILNVTTLRKENHQFLSNGTISTSNSTWVKSYAQYKTDGGKMVTNKIGKNYGYVSHTHEQHIKWWEWSNPQGIK